MPIDSQIAPFIGGKSAFTQRMNTVVSPVNRLLREFNERNRGGGPDLKEVVPVMITALEDGLGYYTVTLLDYPSAGVDPTADIVATAVTVDVTPNLLAYNLSEITSGSPLAVGDYAWAINVPLVSTDGRMVVSIIAGGGSDFFYVLLTTDGGGAGGASTECSYTYTVKSKDGTTVLGTAVPMTGHGQRSLDATMEPGTWGFASYDSDGDLILLWADERFDQSACGDTDNTPAFAF